MTELRTGGHAVHVGIDRYDPHNYPGLGSLRSAEHDARAMFALTSQQDFKPCQLLLGRAATVQRVRDEIAIAASVLVTGDSFVLTFSGFGSVVPDIDRALCMYDHQLLASLLYTDLSRFQPGVRVVIIEDCSPRVLTEPGVVRAVPTPIADAIYAANRARYDRWADDARRGKVSFMVPVLSIHACGPRQEAREGALHGRFTDALLSAWGKGEYLTGPDPSYRDLVDKATMLIGDSQQVPEISTLTTNDQRIAFRPPFVLSI